MKYTNNDSIMKSCEIYLILLYKRKEEDIYEPMESDFRILLSTALCQADICALKLFKNAFVIIC